MMEHGTDDSGEDPRQGLPQRARGTGEFAVADVHVFLAHDGTAPLVLEAMKELGMERTEYPSKVLMFIDHASPSPAPAVSDVHSKMRDHARRHGMRICDAGDGIFHQLFPSEGFVRPGM
jgi:3-isopropylmalate/(R)-2-methylmalate dehydratase large subunit